jgi:hypothetical protein
MGLRLAIEKQEAMDVERKIKEGRGQQCLGSLILWPYGLQLSIG